MKKTIAIKLVGGLSNTSKMPGKSYGLPTANCKTGAKLAAIEGTICSKCYANRGFYKTYAHTVIPAQQRRLESITSPDWVEAMVESIKSESYFRWFDSGDLQSVEMLKNIAEVARRTPETKHWVATRERAFVSSYLRTESLPDNVVVRVSATFADVPVKPIDGAQSANVHKLLPAVGFSCMAPQQGGTCGDCRACWNKSVPAVSYLEH